jgi:hypothetical protein
MVLPGHFLALLGVFFSGVEHDHILTVVAFFTRALVPDLLQLLAQSKGNKVCEFGLFWA